MPRRRRSTAALRLLALLLCSAPGPALAAEDHFVPPGVIYAQVEQRSWAQTEAVSNRYQSGGLEDYLVASREARAHLDGAVSRTQETTTLTTHLGIAQDWNLTVSVDQVQISQQSSLRALDGNAEAEAAAAAIGDDSISGLGALRLGLLKRSVFTDRHGYHWGLVASTPLAEQQNDYVGRPTLATAPPHQTLGLVLHYTYYPVSIPRARLDLRPTFAGGFGTEVTTPEGRSRTLQPGNEVNLGLSWQQEFVPVTLALELEQQNRLLNRLNNVGQGDASQTLWARVRLGWGTLADLEQGPVTLPYRLDLTVEQTTLVYNAPTGTALRLSLLTYF